MMDQIIHEFWIRIFIWALATVWIKKIEDMVLIRIYMLHEFWIYTGWWLAILIWHIGWYEYFTNDYMLHGFW